MDKDKHHNLHKFFLNPTTLSHPSRTFKNLRKNNIILGIGKNISLYKKRSFTYKLKNSKANNSMIHKQKISSNN